jgi:hypothetical protein
VTLPATERAERDAQRSFFGHAPGTARLDLGEAVCTAIAALPGVSMVNRVTGLGLGGGRPDLGQIEEFFREHRCRSAIAVHPDAEPWLEDELRARDYERGYGWTKFDRGSEPPRDVETDLEVHEAGPDQADAFARVVIEGYGMTPEVAPTLAAVPGCDGYHCYVAWAGDEPAAAGALYAGDGVGWLGFAATRTDFRRRGGQGAVLAARIRKAAELGVETLVTETGELVPDRPSNSYRNIERFGFTSRYVRPNWIAPA